MFSPISIAVTVFSLAVLGVVLWRTGGLSFNPGPVSAKSQPGVVIGGFRSHADFEQECSHCHDPGKGSQAVLCVACHQDIADQQTSGVGLHGRLEDPNQCAACHAEHKGRDFDPTAKALVSFDHSRTNFPLLGKHMQVACADCHQQNQYHFASTACIQCHQEPAVHAGMFGGDCATCHDPKGWSPATLNGQSFNHDATGFSLAHHQKMADGTAITCTDCHQGNNLKSFDPQSCTACHTAIDASFTADHTRQFGPDCTSCHDGADRMVPFDHQQVFPLDGKHAGLACESCHADQKFSGTPTQCVACHQEPAIHAGFFGLQCERCHLTSAWQPAQLRVHPFPIDHGGQGDQTCQTCHTGPYTEYTCYTCHDHQPDAIAMSHSKAGISPDELANCAGCHPGGVVLTKEKP